MSKPVSICSGCEIPVDEWPYSSHQWIEGTDAVHCQEIGGDFDVIDRTSDKTTRTAEALRAQMIERCRPLYDEQRQLMKEAREIAETQARMTLDWAHIANSRNRKVQKLVKRIRALDRQIEGIEDEIMRPI